MQVSVRAVRRADGPKLNADAILEKPTRAMIETTEKVVVVGASTGEMRLCGTCWKRYRRRARHRDCAAYAGGVHGAFADRLDNLPDFRAGSRTMIR